MDQIGASLDGSPQFGLNAGNYKESLTALDERNDFVGFKQRSFTSSDLVLAQADAQLPTIETIDSSKIIYMKSAHDRYWIGVLSSHDAKVSASALSLQS